MYAANFNTALSIAGFSHTFSVLQASSISLAPFRKLSMSSPIQAASDKPTSQNTENLPPTPSGTLYVSQPFSFASFLRRVGFSSFGSVTATTSSSMFSSFKRASYITIKLLIVSSVPPDLEITRSKIFPLRFLWDLIIPASLLSWSMRSFVRRGSMLLPLK